MPAGRPEGSRNKSNHGAGGFSQAQEGRNSQQHQQTLGCSHEPGRDW